MPTLTDLTGPAGPLEALLDEPARIEGAAVRAAVVFAHPHPQFGGTMHTKAVYQGAKGLTRIGCAVLRFNFRGVGRSAGQFDQGEGEQADFTAALDYMAGALSRREALGGGLFVRRVGRARGRRGRRPRVGAHRHRAAGRDVDLGARVHLRGNARQHEAEVLRAGRSRRGLPARGDVGVLREAAGTEGARHHRRRRIICSRDRPAKLGKRWKTYLGDFEG